MHFCSIHLYVAKKCELPEYQEYTIKENERAYNREISKIVQKLSMEKVYVVEEFNDERTTKEVKAIFKDKKKAEEWEL